MDAQEKELEYFENLFDDTERSMRQYQAERRRRVNDLHLIHRLPEELLVRILYLSLQNPNIRSYYSRRLERSLVCFRWAEVIESTPSFWSVAHSATGKPSLEKILVKSRNTPLDVAYDPFDLRGPSFYEQVTQHSHRWRSLELFNLPENQRSMMALSLPRLEELYMLGGELPTEVDPSEGKLRHVRLESIDFRWPVRMFQNLETLDLSCLWPQGLSTAQLFDMLRLSPGLVELTLFRTDGADENHNPLPTDTALVPLDHLLRLRIAEQMGTLIPDLLTYIRVPRCDFLSVKNIDPENSPVTALLASPVRSIVQKTGWLRIKGIDEFSMFTASRTGYLIENNQIGLHINPIDIPLSEFISWIVPILQSIHPLPELELDLGVPAHSPTPLDAVWPLFDLPIPITSLRLWNQRVEPVIEYLSSPTSSSHGTPRSLPLPRLRNLTLDGCSVAPDRLLRMVRSRYLGEDLGLGVADAELEVGDGQRQLVLQPAEPSSPLECLSITGRHQLQSTDVEQLESVMGRGTVRVILS